MKPHFPSKRSAGKLYANTSKGRRKQVDPEELPTRESTHPGRRGWREGGRDRGWKLMDRLLEKRVGCLWDEVYSEVCASDDADHLREVVKSKVERDTFIDDDGDVAYNDCWLNRGPCKVKHQSGTFYVDPIDRTLRRTPLTSRRTRRETPQPWRLIKGAYYLSVVGIWYRAELVPPHPHGVVYAIEPHDRETLPEGTSHVKLDRREPPTVIRRTKQLNRRELKALGLVNAVT